jgi:hypothetical protein
MVYFIQIVCIRGINKYVILMESSAPNTNRVFIVGVGMTKFTKPSDKSVGDYPDFAKIAAKRALRDAGIKYDQVEQAFIGY